MTRPHSNVWVFTFYREYVRSYLPRHHPQVLLQGRRGFPAGPDLPPPVLRPHPAPPHSMVWFQHCAEEIGTGRLVTFPRFLVLPFPGPSRMVGQTNVTGPTSRIRSNAGRRKMSPGKKIQYQGKVEREFFPAEKYVCSESTFSRRGPLPCGTRPHRVSPPRALDSNCLTQMSRTIF